MGVLLGKRQLAQNPQRGSQDMCMYVCGPGFVTTCTYSQLDITCFGEAGHGALGGVLLVDRVFTSPCSSEVGN